MKKNGFTFTEILIYSAIAFIIIAVVVAFIFWITDLSNKNNISRETSNSAKRAMEIIVQEIKDAESIYTPTSTASQLSLETEKYLPTGEKSSYIDFYLCGDQLCLKKESQNSIVLTPENMKVTNLNFAYINPMGIGSVKISLTVEYKNPSNRPEYQFSSSVISTETLRSY